MKCQKCGMKINNILSFSLITEDNKELRVCSSCNSRRLLNLLREKLYAYSNPLQPTIPFMKGRPNRDTVISKDDITNLKIDFETKNFEELFS